MSESKLSYPKIIEKNLFEDPDWGPYVREGGSPPDRPYSANLIATYLFYLGSDEKAREVSGLFATSAEEKFDSFEDPHPTAYFHGFRAALFWSLVGEDLREESLWKRVVVGIESLSDEEILRHKAANQWVMQAYAYTKLEEYSKVREPAQRGRGALESRKGTFKAPHRNSQEFALAPLLIRLAEFKMNDQKTSREEVQEALQVYKTENVRYGRLGYPVIFDLQFSYPEVFDPVLPGEDPEKD